MSVAIVAMVDHHAQNTSKHDAQSNECGGPLGSPEEEEVSKLDIYFSIQTF